MVTGEGVLRSLCLRDWGATPLIEMIKQRKVGVRLIVVGTETTAQVFKDNPNVDSLMKYSLKHHGLIPFALLL